MDNSRYQHYPYFVYTYDSVDSTNAVARRAITMTEQIMDRSVHVAGQQTEGRGRNGRSWLNTDDAVLMSIVRITKLKADMLPMLNLAAAVAVREAVKKLTEGVVELSVKWPNDLVTADRHEKVCGILSECVSLKGRKYAVIGIGLNLNERRIPDGLLQPASSVVLQYGKYIRILDAVNAIIDAFDVQYDLLSTDPEAFLENYAGVCVSVGRHVKVDDGKSVRYGMGDKLAPNGQLIVSFEGGSAELISAADVSIRDMTVIDEKLALKLRPKRKASANKGSFGKAAMIVGSPGMPGAALMSTKACIRAGAGLTRALIPESLLPSFAAVPEAMLVTDDSKADELIEWADVVCIGCGMGVSERTCGLLKKVLLSKKPCVIDADALNTMAANRDLLKFLHEKAVITPHPKEMAGLIDRTTQYVLNNFTPSACAFAGKRSCSVLLKSASSVIVSPEGTIRYNDSGSSALAKGGSGDVLAGMITAFIAQGAAPFDAASLGAYTLGISAEKALDFLHNRFVTAEDITDIIDIEINGRKEK